MNAKMYARTLMVGLLVLFVANTVSAACNSEVIADELEKGRGANAEGLYDAAAINYGMAAVCSAYMKDYDSAINYTQISAKLFDNAGMSSSTSYVLIAEYYSKKGVGFEDKVKENCDLSETKILKEIDIELAKPKPSYSTIYSAYDDLTRCYKLVGDKQKTCDYCEKDNDYRRKEGSIDPSDCSLIYGCPKSSSNNALPIASESLTGTGNNLPLVPIAIGLIILLVIAAFFLSRKKKK